MFDIEEVLELTVLDDDPSDEFDKRIEKVSLTEISDSSITIQVAYYDIKAISAEINEPDSLEIVILKPDLFVDAETYKPLDKQSHKSQIQLQQ